MEVLEKKEELKLDKEVIVDLAKNVKEQYNTFAGMLKERITQTLALQNVSEEMKLEEVIPSKILNSVATAIHGIIINVEDIKLLIASMETLYQPLYDKYSNYLEFEKRDDEGVDIDMLGAEVNELMHPYLNITTDISSKIDVLTETYAISVQAPIELILNNLTKANMSIEKLLGELDESGK